METEKDKRKAIIQDMAKLLKSLMKCRLTFYLNFIFILNYYNRGKTRR